MRQFVEHSIGIVTALRPGDRLRDSDVRGERGAGVGPRRVRRRDGTRPPHSRTARQGARPRLDDGTGRTSHLASTARSNAHIGAHGRPSSRLRGPDQDEDVGRGADCTSSASTPSSSSTPWRSKRNQPATVFMMNLRRQLPSLARESQEPVRDDRRSDHPAEPFDESRRQ